MMQESDIRNFEALASTMADSMRDALEEIEGLLDRVEELELEVQDLKTENEELRSEPASKGA